MKIPKRLIWGTVIGWILGLGLLVADVVTDFPLDGYGAGALSVAILQSVRIYQLCKHPEKLKAYQCENEDERNIWLSQKSYATALWISIAAEYMLSIVFALMKKEDWQMLMACTACFQVLLISGAYLFYRKRY